LDPEDPSGDTDRADPQLLRHGTQITRIHRIPSARDTDRLDPEGPPRDTDLRGSKINFSHATQIASELRDPRPAWIRFTGSVEFTKTRLPHYLKASDHDVGLLVNFGRTPQFKRVIRGTARRCAAVQPERDDFRVEP
jgi:hypothetical protein